jgi:hypothetical protein
MAATIATPFNHSIPMSAILKHYEVLYADAPYLSPDATAHIFANLKLYTGDFIMETSFSEGLNGHPDELTYIIQEGPQNGSPVPVIAIPQSIEVVPSGKEITISLKNSQGTVLIQTTHPLVYGAGTYDSGTHKLYHLRYLATPYYNQDADNSSSAYAIVNMPVNNNDQIYHTFTPNTSKGIDTLTINVMKGSGSGEIMYCEKMGPFNPISDFIEVQVCVNGKPDGGPKAIKSYGQDSYHPHPHS